MCLCMEREREREISWSRCLACSWATEVEAGQFASDRDAVTNLLRNALG